MPSLKIKRAKSRAKNKDREQLDKALEEELKDTADLPKDGGASAGAFVSARVAPEG